jgi:hypothetical protein
MKITTLLNSYSGISTDNITIYLKDKTIKIADGTAHILNTDSVLIDAIKAVLIEDVVKTRQLGTLTIYNNTLIIFEKGLL